MKRSFVPALALTAMLGSGAIFAAPASAQWIPSARDAALDPRGLGVAPAAPAIADPDGPFGMRAHAADSEVAPSSAASFVGTVAASGLLSVAGVFLGAVAVCAGGCEESAGTVFLPITGSVVGGGLGASVVTGRSGRSFLGSILGTAAAVAVVANTSLQSTGGAVLTYGLVQGFVTALVAAR